MQHMKIHALHIEKILDGNPVSIHPVLIQLNNCNYLVDCGYKETFNELKFALLKLGVHTSHINGLIITHDDYDHLGAMKTLKDENPGMKIYCGELERDSVEGKIKSERLLQAEASLHQLPDEYKPWAEQFVQTLCSVERCPVDHIFTDGELLEQEIRIIHTPGHTRGHISVYLPNSQTLIAGDALVIENGSFNIANPQYTLNLPQAIQSVEMIMTLNPSTIICYHGGIMHSFVPAKLTQLLTQYKSTNE